MLIKVNPRISESRKQESNSWRLLERKVDPRKTLG